MRRVMFTLAVFIPGVLSAQTMRTYSATRPIGAEKVFTASVEFGAGSLVIEPSQNGQLYMSKLRYDADRFAPVQQFESAKPAVRLGLASVGGTGIKVTSRAQLAQTGLFEFSPEVPLSLTANVGASQAMIELGGMTLRDVTVNSGASSTVVSFSKPTKGSCSSAVFSVGATDLDIRKLAQSGCRRVKIEGGVGSVLVDMNGTWRGNTELVVELAMGKLTLVIPKGTGVRIDGQRFLSPMDSDGFTKSGNSWITPGFDKAEKVLQVQLKTAMAGIEIRWN